MDENDLLCIDKYLNLVRDSMRTNPGQVRRVTITFVAHDSQACIYPDLIIDMAPMPEAIPVTVGG